MSHGHLSVTLGAGALGTGTNGTALVAALAVNNKPSFISDPEVSFASNCETVAG